MGPKGGQRTLGPDGVAIGAWSFPRSNKKRKKVEATCTQNRRVIVVPHVLGDRWDRTILIKGKLGKRGESIESLNWRWGTGEKQVRSYSTVQVGTDEGEKGGSQEFL